MKRPFHCLKDMLQHALSATWNDKNPILTDVSVLPSSFWRCSQPALFLRRVAPIVQAMPKPQPKPTSLLLRPTCSAIRAGNAEACLNEGRTSTPSMSWMHCQVSRAVTSFSMRHGIEFAYRLTSILNDQQVYADWQCTRVGRFNVFKPR